MISLEEFVSYRLTYCQQHHRSGCQECFVLVNIAKHIIEEGIAKVSIIYHKFFPDNKYKSDKAVRRLLQLPVAIFKMESQIGHPQLYVTGYYPGTDFSRLVFWINKLKLLSPRNSSGLDKNTLSALCKLASSDKDRSLVKFAACEAAGLTSSQARKVYGVNSFKEIEKRVQTAVNEAAKIRQAVIELANIEEQALLQSLRIQESFFSEGEEELEMVEVEESSAVDWPNSSDSEKSETEESSSEMGDSVAESLRVVEDDSLSLHSPQTHSHHSYDPDTVDKTSFFANPAPSHEVLLNWLRENDLNWFSFYEEVSQYLRNYSSEELNQVLLDFTDYLSNSDLSEDEERRVEISRQAFLELQRRRLIDNQDIQSDSDNDEDPDWSNVEISNVVEKELQEKVKREKVRIKRRAQRKASKEITERCILNKKVPPGVSRLLKQFPDIGKDMEEFVESKRVGADAWRRTGLLTFDGNRKRGKKVTYSRIKEHLEQKYNTRISYGSIVQLCVARNKRLLSAKRYKGVAKVTCRRARKGFTVRLNPDAHWSCALYKGLDILQLKDGSNKMVLNRDDQAGFRLDTTYDHKHSKTITTTHKPALTTRTDFVNAYPSVLQTTSYLFMETETAKRACVGVVKAHYVFPKNATQHAADLDMLQNDPQLQPWVSNREVDCIRVDGASDEGPCHSEVQFYWTERHINYEKVCTLVTSRHSGGSYLNRVELMNGGLSQAHCNLFIPSTLNGSNYGPNGLDEKKLKKNLEEATEVYIDRVQGASCCGSPVLLMKGAVADMHRRQHLLTFLKGSKKAKEKLQSEEPELYNYFQDVWTVRNNHINTSVPTNYVFHLTLCGKSTCVHPRCKRGETSAHTKWFKGGPPVTWLPIPVPDPDRPGHFMKAEDLIHGKDKCPADVMSIPPSAVIKQAAKDDDALHNVEGLAQKLLLPIHEVKWHLDYHRQILDKRKRKKKKGGDCSATPDCISCNVKADLSCASEQCSDSYCLKCLNLEYPPPLEWMCRNCQDETPLYCLCQQGEFGVMLGCDGDDCSIEWFHLQCVGLSRTPTTEKWLCPHCKDKEPSGTHTATCS